VKQDGIWRGDASYPEKPSCTGNGGHKTEAEEENPRRRRVQRVADSRIVLRTQGRRSLVTERRIKP
jgi:hypothetical protein